MTREDDGAALGTRACASGTPTSRVDLAVGALADALASQ